MKLSSIEINYLNKYKYIIGIDEAGRGPLAGPVVAAAVLIDKNLKEIKNLKDSKKLTSKKRLYLFEQISKLVKEISIAVIDNKTIDKINILNASLLAMKKAYINLKYKENLIFIDGNKKIKNLPKEILQIPIVKGDDKLLSIAAASIIAKVYRDNIMKALAKIYPQYKLDKNKGYPTKEHKLLIEKFGLTKIHRLSFNYKLKEKSQKILF